MVDMISGVIVVVCFLASFMPDIGVSGMNTLWYIED